MSVRHEVAICIPAGDHCQTWFAYDLARLVGYTVAHGTDVGVKLIVMKTAYLPSSRTNLARAALETGCTHALWLDSDMRFPKDALLRLLAHDVPIVAASYSMRRLPLAPVASDSLDQGAPHYVADGARGLEPVGMVGMGCMLTTTAVFRQIPEPWFAVPFDLDRRDFIGEDVWFCAQAKEHGIPVLIDAALTNEVGHLGEWEFTNRQLNQYRAASADAAPAPSLITVETA